MSLMKVSNESMQDQADLLFMREATKIVKRLAGRYQYFTVNEFWDAVDRMKNPVPIPSDRRMLGKVFRAAASQGLIVNTNVAVRSARHGNYYRPVWQSLVITK